MMVSDFSRACTTIAERTGVRPRSAGMPWRERDALCADAERYWRNKRQADGTACDVAVFACLHAPVEVLGVDVFEHEPWSIQFYDAQQGWLAMLVGQTLTFRS